MPAERWMAEAQARCAADPILLREVRSLLDCHARAGDFLDAAELLRGLSLAPKGAAPTADEDRLPAGTRLGGYTICRFLGSGGMGDVYVAEQERPRRTVALKLIRRGVLSPSLLRRFEAEAEVLGRLQHPGIAQIFEAGTACGEDPSTGGPQPFIAMELVNGPPLTEYAEQRRLDVEQRLDLMALVCDAVHHAHQRGIIHRDLKPGNILVDEHGQPKVLDFGVARAADSDLRITTLQTFVGQLIGTLPYMSPEQVGGDPADIDTRSDVYALGVILYQLLAGRLPHDLGNRSLPDAARVIREEMPSRISSISRIFRGEVDAIVSKAMDKDKTRRYQSAAELADDIRRFRSGQPILAKQESSLYVLRKAIRRYQTAVAAIAVLMIALAAFSIFAWRQLQVQVQTSLEAQAAAQRAEGERLRADARTEQVRQQLRANLIERGRAVAISGNLAAAESILWPLHLENPTPHSYWALWDTYARLPCLARLTDHTEDTRAIAASPDGRYWASGTGDGSLVVWDAASLRPTPAIPTVRSDHGAIVGVAFSRNSRRLYAAWSGGAVAAWSLGESAAAEDLRFTVEAPGVSSLHLVDHEAGPPQLVLGCTDGAARIHAAADGSLLRTLRDSPPGPVRLAANSDGSVIAVGAADGIVRLWRNGTGQHDDAPSARLRGHTGPIASLAFNPDGTLLVSGGGATEWVLRFWNIDPQRGAGAALDHRPWNNGTVRGLHFSRDGRRLLSWGYNHVVIWDALERQPLPQRISQPALAAVFSSDERLVIASDGIAMRVWHGDGGGPTRTVELGPGEATVLASDGGPGDRLAIGSSTGAVRLWTISPQGEAVSQTIFQAHQSAGAIRSLAFDPSGERFIAGSDDGYARVWDATSGGKSACIATLGPHPHSVRGVVLSRDGARAVTICRDRYLRVWDVAAGSLLHTLDSGARDSIGIDFSADGQTLYSSHSGGRVLAWDAATWEHGSRILRTSGGWTLAALPGLASGVAIGDWTGGLRRWNPATGEVTELGAPHTQIVYGLATTVASAPASNAESPLHPPIMLASCSNDGLLHLCDPIGAVDLATIAPDVDRITSVAFVARGRFLVGANGDSKLCFVDLETGVRRIEGNRPPRQVPSE